MGIHLRIVLALLLPATLLAQDSPEMRQILERLDRLEAQNKALMSEIHALRAQLAEAAAKPSNAAPAASPAPGGTAEPGAPAAGAAPDTHLEERVAVAEQRISDLDQSKVEAEHKLPIHLTGMLLFNAFANGRNSGNQQYPTTASAAPGPADDGASLRQSILGLKFDGPEIFGGGKVSGSLFLDLWGGTASPLNQLVRLRVASVDLSWQHTTISFGQDKPILAPRDPTSLAQVAFSPLTGAGNLWLWAPQARVEQRFDFGERSGLRAQLGVYQTNESTSNIPSEYHFSSVRPALEGRFEFWHDFGNERRIEIAPGFHASESHVGGLSIPARVASADWLIRPARRIDFTGTFFWGENTSVLGGERQGIAFLPNEQIHAVPGTGGWAQLTLRATERLSFNIYGGTENHHNVDLCLGCISSNETYAGNVIYRLGSNVLVSFEASQTRTDYFGMGLRLNPHYDLAIAYLY